MMYPITDDFLPVGSRNRPGMIIKPTAIVSHRTGNPRSTAKNNRNYWANTKTTYASAHYLVDAKEIIHAIPDNEKAYHVASKTRNGIYIHPNDYALGIEFCEPYTREIYLKYVWLHAYLCYKYNIPLANIKPHSYYDPVDRPNDTGDLFDWDQFINDVTWELGEIKKEMIGMFTDIVGHWAKGDIEYLAKLGIVKGYEDGSYKPDKEVTRAEVASMIAKAMAKIKSGNY